MDQPNQPNQSNIPQKSQLNHMTNFLKKPVTIVILAVLLIGIVGYVYFRGDDAPAHEFTVAERRDLIQEVSVIGSVRLPPSSQ